jgi:membrane protein
MGGAGPGAGTRLSRWGWPFLQQFYRLYTLAHVPFFAAALAYYAIFSLMPMLFLLVGVFGWLLRHNPALQQATLEQLAQATLWLFPTQPDLAQQLLGFLDQGATPLTLGSLVVLLWTASNFFTSLSYALRVIFGEGTDLQPPPVRLQVWRALRGRVAGLLAPLALGLGLLLLVLLGVGLSFVTRYLPGWLGRLEDELPLLLALALFYLAYRALPLNPPAPWQAGLSAVLAALTWQGMRLGLPLLLPRSQYELIYGPVAGFLLTLLGFYLTVWILLLGAVLARSLSPQTS